MASPVLLAATVTVLPAIGALWYLLKRYEDYFEDSRVFLALIFGFFGGLFAIFMEMTAFPFAHPQFIEAMGVATAFAFFVGAYAFFETGCKTVVLGMKRFRNRKDTPYYGAAMGLGFGAMMALGFVAINLNAVDANAAAQNITASSIAYSTPSFLTMASVPLGAIFVHGAAGVFVGKGAAEGKLVKGWGIGALIQMPVLIAYWLFWPSIGRGDVVVLLPALLALVYGLGLMHFVRKRVLDTIVPQHIRDLVRREKRREARRAHDEEE